MKKFFAIFSICLFLSFNINTTTTYAETKSFGQGLYRVKDMGLSTDSAYKVKNSSPTGRAIVILFDGNQLMQEFLRLEPNSPDQFLKPLGFDYIIVIVGGGNVAFS